MRKAEDRMLQPRKHQGHDDEDRDDQKRSGADPDAKAAILWIVNRLMDGIERNHQRILAAGSEVRKLLETAPPEYRLPGHADSSQS
jgi:hypothetical protein